jgi:outer membrane biosynthesis protein TonB
LGPDKVGENSSEREGQIGDVLVPPQTTPKNQFAPKPNQLLKPREKPSEKPSEKPCEETHPKPKPKPVCFHCGYCGKDGHRKEFCYKRKREARMAKEWTNKDRYYPSHGVPEPRMPLPKGKVVVCTVPAWRDRSALERSRFAG